MKHLLILLCAWILWGEFTNANIGDKPFERGWQMMAAFNGYEECLAQTKVYAQSWERGTGENIKERKTFPTIGKGYAASMEFKKGGSALVEYRCFPDTVKPST